MGKQRNAQYAYESHRLFVHYHKKQMPESSSSQLVVQETASKLQEEYTISLRMNLDSLEAFDNNLFSDQDIEKIISRALDTLSEKCRTIFIMSKIEGKKQKEIAQELNISINTIETQMGIAYKKLRIELKDYFPILLFILCL